MMACVQAAKKRCFRESLLRGETAYRKDLNVIIGSLDKAFGRIEGNAASVAPALKIIWDFAYDYEALLQDLGKTT